MFGYIQPHFTPPKGALTNTAAKKIVDEARRLGHDIYTAPGSVNQQLVVLTVVSDDRIEHHEVTKQFAVNEGLSK